MANVTPLFQPPIGDLRDALRIAERWADMGPIHASGGQCPFEDIARLLRHALEQLGEPNEAAIRAASVVMSNADAAYDNDGHILPRYARDAAAVILKAQLTGTL